MWSAGQGDNQERFLADLRALRDAAALGYDELAARAHFPSSVIKEAENGPGLPGLPILAAYVRACDADVPEWEERWRRLAYDAETDPGLPVRPPGASPAAVAGARAGVTMAAPDVYDPERIRAALRGGAQDRGTRSTSDVGSGRTAPVGRVEPDPLRVEAVTPEGPAAWNGGAAGGWGDRETTSWSGSGGAVSAWDTTPNWTTPVTQDTLLTNGNHHPAYPSSAFDGVATEAFGSELTSVTEEDPVPAWLADSEVARPPEADHRWSEPEETEPARWLADSQLTTPVVAEDEAGTVQFDAFVQDARSAQDAGSVQAAGFAKDTGYAGTTGAAATQAVRAPMVTAVPGERRRDRFLSLRLIAVMVIAAIIGSVLVLVIR